MSKNVRSEDINAERSSKAGLVGSLETFLRKFRHAVHLITALSLGLAYVIAIGTSLTPGMWIILTLNDFDYSSSLLKALVLSLAVGIGFILFILTLIVVVPILNYPMLRFVKPYRGGWFSLESIPWFYHNALTYLVRYTILDFITPTPLNIFFFRAMGMKIGKNCMINSSNISDPCLIELGDNVTIGGSAYLMAHYGMHGYLIIDHLKIGKGTTVGLNAKILGGVSIGEKVSIAPNHCVLPKTNIPDGSKVGIPSSQNDPK